MKKRSYLLMFLAILHSMASWCAMPDGYTFYTTTNGVSTAFTALPTAYRCAIGIAWNSTQRTSSSMPTEIGAGIPTDYQGAFVIPSFLTDQAYYVTEIGYKAFYKCKGLTSVSIPNSINYIDVNAFMDCVGLERIEIPGSVTIIDQYSFALCSNLEHVTINEGVREIENYAFLACSSLKSIEIPVSVTKIGTKAFGRAKVNHDDYGYGSYEGCDNLTKVIVHWDTPITISEGTFSNAANCTLFVPKGKVETYANADIWKDFKEIKEYSPIIDFADASVKSICVNRWDTDGDGELSESEAAVVTDIGTIFRKKAITSFNELKYFTGLTTIGSEAFEKCYSLTSIVVPQNITTISNQAFKECTSLTAINIPRKVTSIGSRAFESCNSLTKVIVEDIASWCSLTCYDNPLGHAHHLYCEDNKEITDLVIPDGVATIGNSAFAYCTSLTSVTMPNSLATIGTSAFQGCTSLESINVPNGVKTIQSNAFSGCSSLTTITFPASVNSIGGALFNGCSSLTTISIDNNNATYESPYGSLAIIDKTTNTIVAGFEKTVIPNGVISIGQSAFSNCNKLTNIVMPNSVTSIGGNAFYGCSGLTSITIPNGVTSIGSNAFNACSGLTEVTVEIETPLTISSNVFSNRANATLYVPSGCKAAYEAADYWKEFKEIVELPAPSPIIAFADANVKALCVANWDTDGDGELSEAEAAAVTNLRNVFKEKQIITSFNELQYFSGLTSIQEGAFYGCSNLSSVTIPNSVTSIGGSAFRYCSSLTNIIIPSTVISIGTWAFNDSGLSSVIVSNGVTSIGEYAFHGTHLSSVTIPSSVNCIGVATFGYCQELSSITVESGNVKYYSNDYNAIIERESNTLIAGCINTSIPFGVEKIANIAFRGCKMTAIEIPSSVTAIGAYAFNWCDKLASITIPSSVSSIGEWAFYGCDCLSSVKVEMESPIIIEQYTFSNCANATLYVPYGSKAAYEAADYWKEFKEIVEIDNRSEQTLALEELPVLTYGDGTYQLPVETEQGLPLSWGIISDHSVVSFPDFNDWRLVIDGAGAATVTATQAGNNDYKPFSREFTLTVNKAALTIIADDKTKLEGEENPPLTVSYDGFKYNDDASALTAQPTVSTTATKESPTGSYPITSSGAASNNYDFTYVEGTLTVLEKHEPEPVEVTDISKLDNVIYIEPMEARTGTQATISLKMKNTAEIRAFQFDLYLPEGVTAVKSAKGKIQGFLSVGRLPDEDEHTLSFSEQPDGAIRFLCGSEYDETFTGNDGEIATLLVNIADNIADGEYPVQLKGMKLTETDISKYYETAFVQSKLTISTYVIGDINGDGVVDVSDYTGVANHIHNNTPAGFNAKAADVDESGGIDVSDYTGIANIIHTGSIYGNNSNVRMMVRGPRKVNTDLSSKDNVIYVKPLAALAGSQATISIKMKNTAEIRSFQFDLQLPDGVTVVKSAKGKIQGSLSAGRLPEEDEHTLSFSEHEGNVIRFLCGSLSDDIFTGNDGEIATLLVDVAANVEAEDHTVYLRNMKLSESDISKFYQTEELGTTLAVAPEGSARGDANGDKSVSVTDIAVVVNCILQLPNNGSFSEYGADANGDGDITVTDIGVIVDKILGTKNSANSRKMEQEVEPQ